MDGGRRAESFTVSGDPVLVGKFLNGYMPFANEKERRFMFTTKRVRRVRGEEISITPIAFTTKSSVVEFFNLFILDQNELLNRERNDARPIFA
jgi:hypothetical protein